MIEIIIIGVILYGMYSIAQILVWAIASLFRTGYDELFPSEREKEKLKLAVIENEILEKKMLLERMRAETHS